ncbi:MAG: DUF4145 domain-containing protein [Hyphomicrobiales bacterium]|nr:MAG: DUF4145 domain-containing protein [Hyphomicrobiales bacterium]
MHCQVAFRVDPTTTYFNHRGLITNLGEASWAVRFCVCPECSKPTIDLVSRRGSNPLALSSLETRVYPKGRPERLAPSEVPLAIAQDFNEAAAVFPVSAQASAALSRRCLQHVLEHAGFSNKDLGKAIEAVIASGIPSYLADGLDAIRNIGNFAAHPTKDKNTGEIVPVEPAEAEWNLDVLELLFDFYFIQPAIALSRTEALNAKLAAAGKKPMKTAQS